VTSPHPSGKEHRLDAAAKEADVKIIGIKVKDKERGESVLESLRVAVAAERVSLDDLALVTNDGGAIHIHQTKDITIGKGARRGALVGALVGLAAPPLLLAAAAGAGAGALWGKFRDKGVDDDLMKRVGSMLADGEAVVFALGDNASIDAVNDRITELADGEITTFTIDDDNEALVRDAAVHVPEPTGLTVRMPYS
jgi:uncharacterized membrane protein